MLPSKPGLLIDESLSKDSEDDKNLGFFGKLAKTFKSNISSGRQRQEEVKEKIRLQNKANGKFNTSYSQTTSRQPKDAITKSVRLNTLASLDSISKKSNIEFGEPLSGEELNSILQSNVNFTELDYSIPPQKRVPTMATEFFEGLGPGYSGGFLNPEIPIQELGFPNKAARVAGYTTGMVGLGLTISAATTGGVITAPFWALNATRLNRAAKLWNGGRKTEAIRYTGVGIKSGGTANAIRLGGPADKNLGRFFKNVSQYGPDKARRLEFFRGLSKEGGVWTALGQLTAEDTVSIQQRLLRAPIDFIAGGLFARSQYKYAQILSPGHTFKNKAGQEVLGYKPSSLFEPVATAAIAGAMAPMLTADGATRNDRILAAGITTAASRFAGGFQFKQTRADVSRALSISGVDDAVSRELLANQISVKVHKEFPKLVELYDGTEFKNSKGFKAVMKSINPKKDDEGASTGAFEILYDVYYPNGKLKAKNVIANSYDEWQKTWKVDNLVDVVEPLENNIIRTVTKKKIDGEEVEIINDIPQKNFQSEKDINKLIEQGKWGIVQANNGPNRILVPAKQGYNYTQLLIEEALNMGYKQKDIIVTNGVINGVQQKRVLIKGLKQNDGFELSRKFGQDGYENQSGFVKINYNKNDNTSASNVQKVEVFKRIPGSTETSKTRVPDNPIKRKSVKLVSDGDGGVKTKIVELETVPGADQTPRPYRSEFYNKEGGYANHMLLTLDNGNQVAVKTSFDFKNSNKTNIPKSLITSYGDDIQSSAFAKPNLAVTKDLKGLMLLTRDTDKVFGFSQNEARGLRNSLFGKPKSSQLTELEHQTYQNLLYGTDNYKSLSTKYNNRIYNLRINTENDRTWGAIGDAMDKVSIVKDGIGNWVLPMYRFWEYSGRKYNSPTMKLISQKIVDKTSETLMIKSEGTIHMDKNFVKKARELGFKESKLTYYNMHALLMPKRFGAMSTLTKKEQKQLQPLVDEHFKFADKTFNLLKFYGVKEKGMNPINGRTEWKEIQKVPNFMPLVITDELAKVFNSNNKSFKNKLLKDIQDQFLKKGITLTEGQLVEKFAQVLSRSEKNGVYGVQFSRQFDLEPVYFLDNEGRVIDSKPKDFYKKVGDKLDGQRIAKRIESYNFDYVESMNRYISRTAHIAPNTKYFGYEGLYSGHGKGGSKIFGADINNILRRMQLEMSPKDFKAYKKYLTSDMEELMGLKDIPEWQQHLAKGSNVITGFTATAMLSGIISPFKNLGLGKAQTWATFGEGPLTIASYNLMNDTTFYLANGIRRKNLELMDRSGSKLSGQQIVETATNNILLGRGLRWDNSKQKYVRNIQAGKTVGRWLTIGMEKAEVLNRNVAAYTGMAAAEMSLNILKGNKNYFGFNVTTVAQQRVMAERMLKETLKMSDESYYQLLSKKRYFNDKGNEIYLTGKQVDLKSGSLKEFKVGDTVNGKKIAKVLDDPREFTDSQRIMIMARAHAQTQGLTDSGYLPKLFNNQFIKPLTLFTRIATSVTDNVYNNILRPAIEDGNVTGMLRYMSASYLNGGGIEFMYEKVLGTQPEKFRTPTEEAAERLLTGEIGGIFQIIAETQNKGGITTLANFTQAENVLNVLNDAVGLGIDYGKKIHYVLDGKDTLDDETADYNVQDRFNAWSESLLKLTALSNQALKIYQNNARPEFKLYKDYRKFQNDYKKNILAENREKYAADEGIFIQDKGRYLFEALEAKFYSDQPIFNVRNNALMFVNYEADQALRRQQDNYTDLGIVWDKAFDKVMISNITGKSGLNPMKLGEEASGSKKVPAINDFRKRLKPKELQEFYHLEMWYNRRLSELTGHDDWLTMRTRYKNNWLATLRSQGNLIEEDKSIEF